MDSNAIIIRHLDVGYKRSKPLVKDVNMEILPGHIYGLMGLNGCGKTALMRTLAGSVQPLSGNVDAFGKEPFRRQASFLQEVMYIPEDIKLPALTQARFIDAYAPMTAGFERETFNDNIKLLGLDTSIRLDKMSAGESRQFMIALGLSTDTRALLLDSPFSNLDPVAVKNLASLIAGSDNGKHAIVIATNRVESLSYLFSDLCVICRGEIALSASMEEISATLEFKSDGVNTSALYSDGLRSIALAKDISVTDADVDLLFSAICESERFRNLITQLFAAHESD